MISDVATPNRLSRTPRPAPRADAPALPATSDDVVCVSQQTVSQDRVVTGWRGLAAKTLVLGGAVAGAAAGGVAGVLLAPGSSILLGVGVGATIFRGGLRVNKRPFPAVFLPSPGDSPRQARLKTVTNATARLATGIAAGAAIATTGPGGGLLAGIAIGFCGGLSLGGRAAWLLLC